MAFLRRCLRHLKLHSRFERPSQSHSETLSETGNPWQLRR